MARSPDYISLLYACVITLGGIFGYAKAGSIPSLAAGLAFGTAVAAAVLLAPDKPYIVLFLSCVLLVVMGLRFYRSGKIMPAGLVALLSLGQVIRLLPQYIR
eukprot:m.16439 g.16439  ORF g.16439 m.16439 type:complete len:102 (+) comp26929_c0_seq1:150-455(+)